MTPYFIQAFIYLCAAVIAVPIAKRLGLGSVLGYLIAGVVIGPVTGLVGQETVTIQHFAEFGVVMMLFLVGLELEPKSLWAMRHRLIGLGGLQVVLTTLVVMCIGLLLDLRLSIALTIGLVFSLSSTAIVLQTFNEKGLARTEGGKNAFSVLLFQDIAVIPMLALIPLLAIPELVEQARQLTAVAAEHHEEMSLVADLPAWAHALVVVGAVVSLVVGGFYLSRPLFRYVANSGLREIFTTTALMLVIGIAALMSLVGLSPALGTFLAGVVLANSEFRHELEADIEPFKGLLLGLFFITVGAGIDFQVLSDQTLLILGITTGLILVKAGVLLVLTFIFRIKGSSRWLLTLSLAQAGEFGFVLLAYTSQNFVLPLEITRLLSLVVALSMFLTPGLFIVFEKLILPRFEETENEREPDKIDDRGQVIIAGIGRFGQIVNRFLVANGVKTIVLDHQAGQIEMMRMINIKSYFGDAARPDLLHTAGIDDARLLVVAIDDKLRSLELVTHVKKHHPQVQVLARAYDRGHNYELRDAGADFIISETYHSAMEMGREALERTGVHPYRVNQLKSSFVETESDHAEAMFCSWKTEEESRAFTTHYRNMFMKLEEVLAQTMKEDRSDRHAKSERGWTPPPKHYAEDLDP
jgi:monovalent cation:proton antiporter-2 (CPA2) family protein